MVCIFIYVLVSKHSNFICNWNGKKDPLKFRSCLVSEQLNHCIMSLWMLTRSRLKQGEGQLETFNPEIGCAHRRNKMADKDYQEEDKKAFRKAFYQMVDWVEKLFANYKERLANKKTKKEKQRIMLYWTREKEETLLSLHLHLQAQALLLHHLLIILVLIRKMFLKSAYFN